MKKIAITIVCLIIAGIGVSCYYMGYANGAENTVRIIVDAIPEMLDIELTPRAKMVLDSNPGIMRMVFTQESLKKLLTDYENIGVNKGGVGPEGFGRNLSEMLNLSI